MPINPNPQSKSVADNISKIEQALKASSLYTAKMSTEFKSLASLSKVFHKESFLGSIANIVAPNTNFSTGINKLIEVYQKGVPDLVALKNQYSALTNQLGMKESRLFSSLQANERGLIDEFKNIVNITDELKRQNDLKAAMSLISDKQAQSVAEEYYNLLMQEKVMTEQTGQLEEQARIYKHIRDLHAFEELGRSAIFGTGLVASVKLAGEYNKAMVQINSNMEVRRQIVFDSLRAQIATGASLQEATTMITALSGQAFKSKEEFSGILETSLQLVDGLGLGVDSVAKLARSGEILHLKFKDVADTMATILNNTRLTAAEAESMFETLSKAYIIMGQAEAGVARTLGGIGGELKARTGVSGELERMVANMVSTFSGSQIARNVWGMNPEALGTQQGVQELLARIATRAEADTRGRDITGRLQALENLSSVMGGLISPAALSQLADSIKASNDARDKQITIEQRWRDQMSDTMRAVERLKGSFQALLMTSFRPALFVVQHLSSLMADLVGILGKIPGVMTITSVVMGTLLVVAATRATTRLLRLIVAIDELGRRALGTALKTRGGGVASFLDAFGRPVSIGRETIARLPGMWRTGGFREGVAGMGRMGRFIKVGFATRNFTLLGQALRSMIARSFTLLMSPQVLAMAAAAIGGWFIGKGIVSFMNWLGADWDHKRRIEEQRKAWNLGIASQTSSRADFDRRRMAAIAGGDTAAVEALFRNVELLKSAGILMSDAEAQGAVRRGSFRNLAEAEHASQARAALYRTRTYAAMAARTGAIAQIASSDQEAAALGQKLEKAQLPLLKQAELQLQQLQETNARERAKWMEDKRRQDEEELRRESLRSNPSSRWGAYPAMGY